LPILERAPSHRSQCPAKRKQTVHTLAHKFADSPPQLVIKSIQVKQHDASYSHQHRAHEGQWHDGCRRRREGDGENVSKGAPEGQQQPSWKVTQDGEKDCPIVGHDRIAARWGTIRQPRRGNVQEFDSDETQRSRDDQAGREGKEREEEEAPPGPKGGGG